MSQAQVQRATSAYRSVQVTTASPGQIVVSLYDAAIRFAREGAIAQRGGDTAALGMAVRRAHAVLELLANTLDASRDPSLAARLAALYAYCMKRLTAANLDDDDAPLEEVVRLLAPLRDAWAIAARGG